MASHRKYPLKLLLASRASTVALATALVVSVSPLQDVFLAWGGQTAAAQEHESGGGHEEGGGHDDEGGHKGGPGKGGHRRGKPDPEAGIAKPHRSGIHGTEGARGRRPAERWSSGFDSGGAHDAPGPPFGSGGSDEDSHDDVGHDEEGHDDTGGVSGQGLSRLNAARSLISHGSTEEDAGAGRSPRSALSDYLDEMSRGNPDLAAAGNSLGIAAQQEVTAEIVERVNRLLGISVSGSDALIIAVVAEIKRREEIRSRARYGQARGDEPPDDPGDPGDPDDPGDDPDVPDGPGGGPPDDPGGGGPGQGPGPGGGNQTGDDEPASDQTEPSGPDSNVPQSSEPSGGAFPVSVFRNLGQRQCDDIAGRNLSSKERISGPNLRRLEGVNAILWPGFGTSAEAMARSPVTILASYQEELEKARPDLVVAGTYLGLVSARTVEPQLVRVVSDYLCVQIDDLQALVIAKVAEDQRAAMQPTAEGGADGSDTTG